MKDDQREILRDEFAKDMAGHQRLQGKIPTIRENDLLAKPVFERIEQEIEDAPPPIRADPKDKEWKTKAEKDGWRVLGEPEENAITVIDPAHLAWWEHVRARVFLLLDKRDRGPLNHPSWYERVMAAFMTYSVFRQRKVADEKNPGFGQLMQVLDDSSPVFGDWTRTKPRRIYG